MEFRPSYSVLIKMEPQVMHKCPSLAGLLSSGNLLSVWTFDDTLLIFGTLMLHRFHVVKFIVCCD